MVSRHPQRHLRRLGFQSLEDRKMMAGNVFVEVDHGDLEITGDNRTNGVRVTQVGSGSYRIEGLSESPRLGRRNLGPTNIVFNGVATPSVVVNNVHDDVRINMRGGDDEVLIGDSRSLVHVPDDLEIRTGDGHDFAGVYYARVGDDLEIFTGRGNDQVFVGMSTRVEDDLTIKTGAASNWWQFGDSGHDRVMLFHTYVIDDVEIDTGWGNYADSVDILLSRLYGDTEIRLHGGDDDVGVSVWCYFRNAEIDGGDGIDSYEASYPPDGNVQLEDFERIV